MLEKKNINNLFYCRTPLQIKIASKLINRFGEDHFIIYHPAGSGQKHHYYFNSIPSKKKIFLKYHNISKLNFFLDFVTYFFLPRHLRKNKYNNFYFASLSHPLVALLEKRVINKKLNLFDDGTFNIDPVFFYKFLRNESRLSTIIRKLLNLKTPIEIKDCIHNHFSIYPQDYTKWMDCNYFRVQLFEMQNLSPNKKISILFGSTDDLGDQRFHSLAQSKNFDLFIPHPDSSMEMSINNKGFNELSTINFSQLIGEDIILSLIQLGFKPSVYALASSILLNLHPEVNVYCICSDKLGADHDAMKLLMQSYGIPKINLADYDF
jgi:hypothetical protein